MRLLRLDAGHQGEAASGTAEVEALNACRKDTVALTVLTGMKVPNPMHPSLQAGKLQDLSCYGLPIVFCNGLERNLYMHLLCLAQVAAMEFIPF